MSSDSRRARYGVAWLGERAVAGLAVTIAALLVSSIGVASSRTNNAGAGVSSATVHCARFVELWAPRVRNNEFTDELLAADGYPEEILAEGFHDLPPAQRRVLIDCLFYELDRTEPHKATDELEGYAKYMLYLLVFDKDNLPEPVVHEFPDSVEISGDSIEVPQPPYHDPKELEAEIEPVQPIGEARTETITVQPPFLQPPVEMDHPDG